MNHESAPGLGQTAPEAIIDQLHAYGTEAYLLGLKGAYDAQKLVLPMYEYAHIIVGEPSTTRFNPDYKQYLHGIWLGLAMTIGALPGDDSVKTFRDYSVELLTLLRRNTDAARNPTWTASQLGMRRTAIVNGWGETGLEMIAEHSDIDAVECMAEIVCEAEPQEALFLNGFGIAYNFTRQLALNRDGRASTPRMIADDAALVTANYDLDMELTYLTEGGAAPE